MKQRLNPGAALRRLGGAFVPVKLVPAGFLPGKLLLGKLSPGKPSPGMLLAENRREKAQRAANKAQTGDAQTPPLLCVRLYDPWLLLSAISLVAIGFLMVASASMEVAGLRYDSPFYFTVRHFIYILLGVIAAGIAFFAPSRFWQRTGPAWLGLAVLLLVLVLMPGIGREVNGSSRWIPLGPINLQASELAKICMIFYLSGYLVRRLDEVRTRWSGFIKPCAVVAVFIVLLLAEPDFGATVVVTGTMMGMIFLSGMRLSQFSVVIMVTIAAVAAVAISQPYRVQRLITFLDPWADPFGSGYQLAQAQIAFGRGEWFGLGLGNSVQKLFYLPEAHTDFIYSVMAEELGMVGAIAVVLLFAILVARIFYLGHRSEAMGRYFQAYCCFGIGFVFAGQALINIGVNVGLLPTKGLTLPLVSYGGSSLVVSLVMIAILCRIHLENYFIERMRLQGGAHNMHPHDINRLKTQGAVAGRPINREAMS